MAVHVEVANAAEVDGEEDRPGDGADGEVTPAEVGLPPGGRRRTPGLRRSELATLADMSVDYLVRLEQGRDRHPSAQVLAALADALRLGPEDRAHLAQLAGASHKRELYRPLAPPSASVRPAVRALLTQLEPAPAYVLNRVGDLLAWTPTYARLAEPLGVLDGEPPNLLRFTFGDPRARAAFPDWDAVADDRVGHLLAGGCSADHDPATEALVVELTERAGDDFARRLDARPGLRPRPGRERVAHPEVGELRLDHEVAQLSDPEGQHLVVLLAADERTSAALDRLRGRRPGALRAVAGQSIA